jgi:putative oxidoreductase
MNLGLLLLRLLLAALLFGHASQKLFGWFRGQGLTGAGTLFHALGVRPGRQMVLLAGTAELVGAALIALGLLTPFGAAVVVGTMTVAAAVNVPNGLWAHQGGYEVALVYAALAAVLAYTGPGAWSLDNALGLTGFAGYGWGTAAIAVGLLGSVPPLLRRRQALAAER